MDGLFSLIVAAVAAVCVINVLFTLHRIRDAMEDIARNTAHLRETSDSVD